MSLGTLGRYRLIRKLAQGGMAEVFLAKSYGAHGFEKPVAIKRVLSRYASDQQFVTMLIDEAKITSLLNHPNVVPVIDFHADGEDCYLVMEYLPGRSFSGLLRSLAQEGRSISIEHLIHIARESAQGLHHAHTKTDRNGVPLKIVHRDVSPQNVLLSFEGYVKIIDFGIARARGRLAQTEAGTLKGKIRYLAPEQVQGREVDGRTDLFALGITVWEALCGRALFTGDSDVQVIDQVVAAKVPDPREINPRVPDELARAVVRALQKNPEDRFVSCEAFAGELRGILARLNPDYDPASLGALVRKQFAAEMEEDAREEAEAEVELAKAGLAGAEISASRSLPANPPRDEPTLTSGEPELPRGSPTDQPRTVASIPKVKRPDPSDKRTAPAAAGRKERSAKGTRAAEARRQAEHPEPEEVLHDVTGPAEDRPGVDRTLTGAEPVADPVRGVVVPLPHDMMRARPDEPTRAFDTRDAAAQQHKPAPAKEPRPKRAAPPTPPVRPAGRGLAVLAVASAVAGAVVAVVAGLVVVNRLDARTPGPGPQDPGSTSGATVASQGNAASTTTAAQARSAQPPSGPRESSLLLNVTPARARVQLDRNTLRSWDVPVLLTPGTHRLRVTLDGFQDEEREFVLAEGEQRPLNITLLKADPPPRTGDDPPKNPDKPERDPARDPGRDPGRDPARDPGRRPDPQPKNRPDPVKPAGKGSLKLMTPGTWANITLDGKKLKEVTPTVVEVPAGAHTIILTRGDGASKTFQVTVEPGGQKTVRGEFGESP